MAAPKKNKNAEIWTFAKSEKLLDKAIELAKKKIMYTVSRDKVKGYEFDFIGELACELETYHENITRDIPRRHPKLKDKVNYIIRLMERNCYSNTKKGIIREATGIVNLKSNHKWTDRNTNENENTNINQNVELSPKELKDLNNELESEC